MGSSGSLAGKPLYLRRGTEELPVKVDKAALDGHVLCGLTQNAISFISSSQYFQRITVCTLSCSISSLSLKIRFLSEFFFPVSVSEIHCNRMALFNFFFFCYSTIMWEAGSMTCDTFLVTQ